MGDPGDSRPIATQRSAIGTRPTIVAHRLKAMSNTRLTKRYPSRPSAGAGTGTGPSASDTSSGARNATSEAAIDSEAHLAPAAARDPSTRFARSG